MRLVAMDLQQDISTLKSSAERQLHALDTEEKTKNALVLPFFRVLGYDPFDLGQVEPQYPIQVKGEGTWHVDYALKVDGAPAVLVQCQKAEVDLDSFDGDALHRRLPLLDTSIVAHTNGLTYRFYADIDGQPSVVSRPFLEFDLLDQPTEAIDELEMLSKSSFDTDAILATAFEHKYGRRLKQFLARQKESADDHFVRFLAAQVFEGEVSRDALETFRPVVHDVLNSFITADLEPDDSIDVPSSDSSETEPVPEIIQDIQPASEGNGDGIRPTPDPSPSPSGEAESETRNSTNAVSDSSSDRSDGGNQGTDGDGGSPVSATNGSPNGTHQENNIATEFAEKVLGRS